MGDITLAVTLNPSQARALLAYQKHHFQLLWTEAWFDLKYREVPEDLRKKRILEDRPALAAQRLINASLCQALEVQA